MTFCILSLDISSSEELIQLLQLSRLINVIFSIKKFSGKTQCFSCTLSNITIL